MWQPHRQQRQQQLPLPLHVLVLRRHVKVFEHVRQELEGGPLVGVGVPALEHDLVDVGLQQWKESRYSSYPLRVHATWTQLLAADYCIRPSSWVQTNLRLGDLLLHRPRLRVVDVRGHGHPVPPVHLVYHFPIAHTF